MNDSNLLQRCNTLRVRWGRAQLARRWLAVVGALVLSLTALEAVQADTLVVTTADDDGPGSLRQALAAAESGDTITFDAGLTDQTITLTSGQLVIDKSLTITGPEAGTLTISGNQVSRVFVVRPGVTVTIQVTIQRVTISDGEILSSDPNPGAGGGGILNEGGTLTIHNSTVRDNNSPFGPGGGIFNDDGTLTVHDSLFSGNVVSDGSHTLGGGGIAIEGGTLEVHNSTFSNNSSDDSGAGIAIEGGTLEVHNSTFSDNSANGGGGGIVFFAIEGGTLEVHNSTFSGNSGGGGGGGIAIAGGTLRVHNSTFNGNSAEFGGGGIAYAGSTGTVHNSTFSGNSAASEISEDPSGGGGILIFAVNEGTTLEVLNSTFNGNSADTGGGIGNMGGTLTVTHSTLSGNNATEGGGIYNSNNVVDDPQGGVEIIGTLTLANTILANSDSGGDCFNNNDEGSTLTPAGVNLIEDGSCGASADPTHFRTGDPLLGDLADNGGPTQTMALLVGSPAIDAAEDDSLCPDTDQRGEARPQGAKCDIGAFEAGFTFTFSGFFPPVDNPPTVNGLKAGSAVPVKFSLGGNFGLGILAAGSPSAQPVACASGAPDAIEEVTLSHSGLTYDVPSQQYTYVWKTDKAWAGTCRQLDVQLSDGSHHLALFKFK